MQKYLSNFEKILVDLLSIGKKIGEKIRALVLLSSLSSFFESLVTVLLVKNSTIKMEAVTSVLLQNEILRWKNRASSSDANSTLVMTKGGGGRRRSDKGS